MFIKVYFYCFLSFLSFLSYLLLSLFIFFRNLTLITKYFKLNIGDNTDSTSRAQLCFITLDNLTQALLVLSKETFYTSK